MFATDYRVILFLSLCTINISARLLNHRHHRHHSNDSHHHNHTSRNGSQHIEHRTVPISRSTGEPLKLTLVNAYPNGFFNPHFNRRWNENEQRDVETNWNREPTAVTSTTTTALPTTTIRSLRDRSYAKHNAVGYVYIFL